MNKQESQTLEDLEEIIRKTVSAHYYITQEGEKKRYLPENGDLTKLPPWLWKDISGNQPKYRNILTEPFVKKYLKHLDMAQIIKFQKQVPLSFLVKEIFEKTENKQELKRYVNMTVTYRYDKIDGFFLDKYQEYFNSKSWTKISKYVIKDEKTAEKFIDKLDMLILSSKNFSFEFYLKHKDKTSWQKVAQTYRNFNEEILKKHKNILPLSGLYNNPYILSNEKLYNFLNEHFDDFYKAYPYNAIEIDDYILNTPMDIIDRYFDKLINYNTIWEKGKFSEEFILKHEDKASWTIITRTQKLSDKTAQKLLNKAGNGTFFNIYAFNLLRNPNISAKLKKELIQKQIKGQIDIINSIKALEEFKEIFENLSTSKEFSSDIIFFLDAYRYIADKINKHFNEYGIKRFIVFIPQTGQFKKETLKQKNWKNVFNRIKDEINAKFPNESKEFKEKIFTDKVLNTVERCKNFHIDEKKLFSVVKKSLTKGVSGPDF